MRGLVPAYRPRPSALHAARPGAAAALCAAFALVGMIFEHPLVLGGALAAIAVLGIGAHVGGEIRRAAMISAPFALLVAVVNPLVSQQGQTLLVRGAELLGRRVDITLEAVVYGAVAGLRVVVIMLAFALFSAAVDPDETLRLFRRISYRSALTAALAVRLLPLLARDAAAISDAGCCRPTPPNRLASARAALRGTLDRAVGVAAALEVRGYAAARRPARERRPWSRHDLRVATGAAAVAGGAIAAKLAGIASFEAYPNVGFALGPSEALLATALILISATPFIGPSARLGVGHA